MKFFFRNSIWLMRLIGFDVQFVCLIFLGLVLSVFVFIVCVFFKLRNKIDK